MQKLAKFAKISTYMAHTHIYAFLTWHHRPRTGIVGKQRTAAGRR